MPGPLKIILIIVSGRLWVVFLPGLRVRLENAGMIPVDAGRAAIRVGDTGEEHITAKKLFLVPGCG